MAKVTQLNGKSLKKWQKVLVDISICKGGVSLPFYIILTIKI